MKNVVRVSVLITMFVAVTVNAGDIEPFLGRTREARSGGRNDRGAARREWTQR